MASFNIFSAINSSDIIWATILPTLGWCVITLMMASFLYSGISKSCQEVKARAALMNSIPLMTVKELRVLAKSENVSLKGIRLKAHIQNHLIHQLT